MAFTAIIADLTARVTSSFCVMQPVTLAGWCISPGLRPLISMVIDKSSRTRLLGSFKGMKGVKGPTRGGCNTSIDSLPSLCLFVHPFQPQNAAQTRGQPEGEGARVTRRLRHHSLLLECLCFSEPRRMRRPQNQTDRPPPNGLALPLPGRAPGKGPGQRRP